MVDKVFKLIGWTVVVTILAIWFFYITPRVYSQECPAVGDIYGQVTCEIESGIKIQVYEVHGPFWMNPIDMETDENGCYSIANLKKGQKYGVYPTKEDRPWRWEPESKIITIDNGTSIPSQ